MIETRILRHRRDVGGRVISRREASFPRFKSGSEEWSIPSHVALSAEGQKELFKTSVQQAGTGNEVFVAPGALPSLKDGAEVTCLAISARRYRFNLLLQDPRQRLALVGALLALIGVIIDGGVTAGKVTPLWRVEESTIFISMMVSMGLKAIGLFLVLWRGLLEEK